MTLASRWDRLWFSFVRGKGRWGQKGEEGAGEVAEREGAQSPHVGRPAARPGSRAWRPLSCVAWFSCRSDQLLLTPGPRGQLGSFLEGILVWSISPPPAAKFPVVIPETPQTHPPPCANSTDLTQSQCMASLLDINSVPAFSFREMCGLGGRALKPQVQVLGSSSNTPPPRILRSLASLSGASLSRSSSIALDALEKERNGQALCSPVLLEGYPTTIPQQPLFFQSSPSDPLQIPDGAGP